MDNSKESTLKNKIIVEYSKSSGAGCAKCGYKIPKGEVRLKLEERTTYPNFHALTNKFIHIFCCENPSEFEFTELENLTSSHQKKLKKFISTGSVEDAKSISSKKGAKQKKRARQGFTTQREHTPKQKFYMAARASISRDMKQFKREYFEINQDEEKRILCPILGVKVTIEEAHVDHRSPQTFQNLADVFVKDNSVKISSLKFHLRKFVDKNLEMEFVKFHKRTAELQVVSAKANLTICRTQK